MADEMISLDKPKLAPGAEQARQDVTIGVSVSLVLIAMTCVALRIFTRAHIVRNMGREDWTIIVAAIMTFVLLLEEIVAARKYKLGFSGASLTPDIMVGNIQMVLALVITYKLVVTLIKVSILIMYIRLAVVKTFERLCKGTIYLLIAWQFILMIIVPAQCTPLRKLWDFTGEVKGRCINANAFYFTTSTFHLLMDIWILILPIKLVLAIPRPPREKVGLYMVFGLGFFSAIASAVRLNYLRLFTISNDPFYDSLQINLWSMIEASVGILCASLPTLKPLFSKEQRYRTREILNKSSSLRKPAKSKGPRVVLAKEISVTSPSSSSSSWMSSARSIYSSASSKISRQTTTTFDEEHELASADVPPPVPPKSPRHTPNHSPTSSLNSSIKKFPTPSPTSISSSPRQIITPPPRNIPTSLPQQLDDAYRDLEQTLRLPATVYMAPSR